MALINGTNNSETLNGTSGNDIINGLAGDDIINGFAGNDTLIGGFGNNILDAGLGIDTLSYSGFGNNVIASLETGVSTFFGGSDTFFNIENIIGSNNDDRLTGNNGDNFLDGSFGNDSLFGGGGNDRLVGGAGFDSIEGGLGNDALLGGDGIDILNGGEGNDLIAGNKGNDTMIGGLGNDNFEWVDGDGSDLIQGGEGTDNLLVNGSITQGDQISINLSGTDIIVQRANLVPITLKTQSIESFNSINGLGGDDVLTISNLNFTSGVSFIQFTGGDGNDRLLATNTTARIDVSGGSGNDSLVSSNGNDELFGNTGNDTLAGGGGDDKLMGAESRTSTPGRGEFDALIGGSGRDRFILGQGGQAFYDDGNGVADGDAANFFNGIDGTGDFARILDFRSGDDIIQLGGPRSNYELKPITNSLRGGTSTQDMGIFKKGEFLQPSELIGIVQDAPSNLNLGNTFQFAFS